MNLINYKDYTMISDSELPPSPNRGSRRGVKEPFPTKLHAMLEDNFYEDVISWQSHGRCFVVRKQEKFVRDVLPQYFKQSKLTSFHRQLNLYGFTRILGPGPDKGGYYHEKCLRGRSHLCTHIIRMITKGPRPSYSYDPDTESNFYTMKPVPKDNITTAINLIQGTHFPSSLEDVSSNTLAGNVAPKRPTQVLRAEEELRCTGPVQLMYERLNAMSLVAPDGYISSIRSSNNDRRSGHDDAEMLGRTAASIPDASINTDDAFTRMLFGSLQQQQQQIVMLQTLPRGTRRNPPVSPSSSYISMQNTNNRTFNSYNFQDAQQQLEATNSLSARDSHGQIISHLLLEDDDECTSFTPLDWNGLNQQLPLDLDIDLTRVFD